MRVWLDDERPAPPGWGLATTVDELIQLLCTGRVKEISLDFDLDESDPDRDGMEVMEWLEDATERGLVMPVIHFHTANPCGAAMFAGAWRDLEARHGLPWVDVRRLKRRLQAI